jgi:hypothetical protein
VLQEEGLADNNNILQHNRFNSNNNYFNSNNSNNSRLFFNKVFNLHKKNKILFKAEPITDKDMPQSLELLLEWVALLRIIKSIIANSWLALSILKMDILLNKKIQILLQIIL